MSLEHTDFSCIAHWTQLHILMDWMEPLTPDFYLVWHTPLSGSVPIHTSPPGFAFLWNSFSVSTISSIWSPFLPRPGGLCFRTTLPVDRRGAQHAPVMRPPSFTFYHYWWHSLEFSPCAHAGPRGAAVKDEEAGLSGVLVSAQHAVVHLRPLLIFFFHQNFTFEFNIWFWFNIWI